MADDRVQNLRFDVAEGPRAPRSERLTDLWQMRGRSRPARSIWRENRVFVAGHPGSGIGASPPTFFAELRHYRLNLPERS
jgi:hypothetical protein